MKAKVAVPDPHVAPIMYVTHVKNSVIVPKSVLVTEQLLRLQTQFLFMTKMRVFHH